MKDTAESRATVPDHWYVVALCPAVAVSDTVANALGLGLTALFVCVATAFAAALLRKLPVDLRWPLTVLVLAATVSCLALYMDAWRHDLYGSLGLFLSLLIANFAIASRAELTAMRSLPHALVSGLRTGAVILGALLILGLARELVGRGSLLHDASAMLGNWAGTASLQLFPADMGFLLAMLPPGAFIAFGLLLAARNWIVNRHRHESAQDR